MSDEKRTSEARTTCAYCGLAEGHSKRCSVSKFGVDEQRTPEAKPAESQAKSSDESMSGPQPLDWLVPGALAEYQPSQLRDRWYGAVVDGWPRALGSSTVVRLRDVEPAYSRDHHPGQNRTTVFAASVECVRPRLDKARVVELPTVTKEQVEDARRYLGWKHLARAIAAVARTYLDAEDRAFAASSEACRDSATEDIANARDVVNSRPELARLIRDVEEFARAGEDPPCPANAVPSFLCGARKAGLSDPPQDCGWPTCGCDPHADKVIEALEEMGAFKTPGNTPLTGRAPVVAGDVQQPGGSPDHMQDMQPSASESAPGPGPAPLATNAEPEQGPKEEP